jgi:hypothetical protein
VVCVADNPERAVALYKKAGAALDAAVGEGK